MKKITRKLLTTYIMSIGAFLLVVGVFSFAYLRGRSKSVKVSPPTSQAQKQQGVNLQPPTEQDKKDVEASKVTPNKEPRDQPASSGANDKKVILHIRQESSSKDVIVTTELYGTGWGQCTLSLQKADQKIIKQADTIFQPAYSTCKGFSIAAAEFPSSGPWVVQVSVTNSDGINRATTQETLSIIK